MSKVTLVLTTLISLSYSCLITNCPRGGKRGDPTFLLENIAREVSVESNKFFKFFYEHIKYFNSVLHVVGKSRVVVLDLIFAVVQVWDV